MSLLPYVLALGLWYAFYEPLDRARHRLADWVERHLNGE